jgi:nitroreductase
MNGSFLLDDPWSVDSADFPITGTPRDKLAFLLNYAVLAPSVLGTEPWLFHVADDSIELHADPTRKLPVTDPQGRELLISCGAALLNLRIAAASYNHELNVTMLPDEHQPEILAEATLGREARPASDRPLRSAITKRRTNRGAFGTQPLPEDLVSKLVGAARQEGAMLFFLTDPNAQRRMLDLAAEARRAQLAIPAYRDELSHWVQKRIAEARDFTSEARQRLGGDVSGAAGGTPEPLDRPELDIPKAAGLIRMLPRATGAGEHCPGARGSSILALLATETDNRENWLLAGQSLQRVLLVAATEGISASYVNGPIETDKLRQRVARAFNVTGSPQVVLQMGMGRERPPTPRRPMSEVVTIGR